MIWHQESEQAVLGGLLVSLGDAAVFARATRLLPDPVMFADPNHRTIYRALRELHEEGVAVDHVTLTRRLATHHASAEISGAYLAELVDMVPTAANIEFHARLVREHWQRREVIAHSRAAILLAEDLRQPVTGTISGVVERLTQTHGSASRAVVTMTTGMADVMADLDRQAMIGPVVGVGTGLPDLDRLTHGLQRGELWIAGARPSIGKSSFVIDTALAAAEIGPVLFLSAEMPAKAIRRRMLARAAAVNLWDVRDRDSWSQLAKFITPAAETLGTLPIRIDDSRVTPADLRAAVVEYTAELGAPPVLVVVDYLQKLSSGRRAENRNLEIGQITAALTRLAVDGDVPVLCAAQLSRNSVKDGKPRRPNMSDLRDSGTIEQDADGILLLHAPPLQPREGTHTQHVEIIVEKNRNGETGVLDAWHDRRTGTWTALTGYERRDLRAA
jgi:replicative DNA helicase